MKLHVLPDETDDDFDFAPIVGGILLLVLLVALRLAFADEARGYALTLPTADAPQTIDRDRADEASLTANGEIFFRAAAGEVQLTTPRGLEEQLKQRLDARRPVILRCDRRCTYEQYVRVKNALLNAGVTMIFEEMRAP